MHRQLPLFDAGTLEEGQLSEFLSPIYPQLWRMLREPFDDLVERRANDRAFRIMQPGECAQWLHRQIVDKAEDVFAGRADIAFEMRRNQFRIRYRDEVAITPKKMKESWLRRNALTFSSYSTPRNVAYWQQRSIEDCDQIPRVIVGYRFIRELTDIEILVGLPRGKHFRICYLMPDQSGVVSLASDFAVVDTDQDQGFEVTSRKAVRKRGSAK